MSLLNWETLGKAVLAGVPVLVTVVGILRGPGALRQRLRHDVELLEKLPEDSEARNRLLTLLDKEIEQLVLVDTEGKRDWTGFGTSLVLVVALGGLGLWLWGLDAALWRALALIPWLFALVGLTSILESLQKIPRDEKGKPR